MWQKIFLWSKKVHRWLILVIVILGIWMMLSGYLLHRELAGGFIPTWIDMIFVRVWHNKVSQWFLVVFLAQMVTGVFMWLAPKMLVRARKVTNQES